MPAWAKALAILALVILCVVLLTASCSRLADHITDGIRDALAPDTYEVTTGFGHPYIGTVNVVGEISETASSTYNQRYLLNAIDAMMADEDNRGLILYVNTPGGSVYASDELYLKIKQYQSETGRPVYASMQSQATSGGYYISAPCDKIIANRNCWTGSIGVTMGTMLDISELLDNLGIKTHTITSGDNKAMGSSYEAMTEEQKEIFQGLVDEAYDQFVDIVAEGRDMDEETVRELADGRIYTAKQALENGLIDAIGTYEEAAADMCATYELGDCAIEVFTAPSQSILSELLDTLSGRSSQKTSGDLPDASSLSGLTDAALIQELTRLNGSFTVSYLANVRK